MITYSLIGAYTKIKNLTSGINISGTQHWSCYLNVVSVMFCASIHEYPKIIRVGDNGVVNRLW